MSARWNGWKPNWSDDDAQVVFTDSTGRVWHPHRGYWAFKTANALAGAEARIADLENQLQALRSPPTEDADRVEVWRPIETHSGHFGVLVSRTPDKYIYGPLAAFLDATGMWRVLGSEGGMTELPFEPTHWQPLPAHVGAPQDGKGGEEW